MTARQSWVRHAEQIADLVLDLAIRAVNRTRDLGAQELAIATAQAVRRDAYGAGAQAERLGRMPVRLVVLVADQMRLEEIEQCAPAGIGELGTKPIEHAREQRSRT